METETIVEAEVRAAELELKSEEVQDIIGRPPSWIVRWGITMMFFVIFSLFGVSWYVEYPDLIKAPVVVTTEIPPTKVVSRVSGHIKKLLVVDNEQVVAGTPLLVMNSVGNAVEVDSLNRILTTMDLRLKNVAKLAPLPIFNDLGALEADYAALAKQWNAYQLFLMTQTSLKQIPFMEQEITYLRALTNNIAAEDSVLKAEIVLANEQYKRGLEVLDIGGTTKDAVALQEQQLLQYKRQRKGLRSRQLGHEITINKLAGEIEQIRLGSTAAGRDLLLSLREVHKRLSGSTALWLEQYVIKAPSSGQVSMHKYWSENQYVTAGAAILTIVPKTQKVLAKLALPIAGSGKVTIGQTVNIKLLSYPFREYGIVKGTIKTIALAPYEDNYTVEVSLPKGLETTYNKTLNFRQQMQGHAEIITKKRRLLERILETFIKG